MYDSTLILNNHSVPGTVNYHTMHDKSRYRLGPHEIGSRRSSVPVPLEIRTSDSTTESRAVNLALQDHGPPP